MSRVTSAEFQKEFGRIRAIAHREPVIITNHGRQDLVVLSFHEYERLKRRDRQALHVSELADEDIEALDSVQFPKAGREFDHEVMPDR
jgi:prevent-host-death family protein